MTDIIDVWMQHPTARFINHPIFDSLRSWTGGQEKKSPGRAWGKRRV